MNRSKTAIKNSSIGLFSQVVSIVFQFVTRSVFIKYLGVEMLGISSTFSSVLNTISLAELGFQSAIVYNLYKPLAEDDKEKVNDTINVLKIIYRFIGIFFIVAGIACLPFIDKILSKVEINTTIYLIFIIQVMNSACSYFLAYKRSLLYADRREFMTKLVDMVMNIVINIIKIIVVIKTSDYLLYISLTTLQTIVSNLIIHVISWKIYPYLHKTKFNWDLFKSIWNNVKNLFVGKIAYYIYSSTDYLVISSLVSTVSVGFMVNYTTIIANLKTLTNSALNPITPIIGNKLASDKSGARNEEVFGAYTYIRYLIAGAIIIPTFVLIQSVITAWVGAEYLLSTLIAWLYCLDLYIHIVHSALCDFINGQGLFKEDRNIEIAGALSNIVISVLLAIKFGIAGVLIGTIISQMVFWIGRSVVAYKNCFKNVAGGLRKYWQMNIIYFIVFAILSFVLSWVYQKIAIGFFPIRFIVGGIICEVVFAAVVLLLFGRTEQHKQVVDIIKNNILIKKFGVKKQ